MQHLTEKADESTRNSAVVVGTDSVTPFRSKYIILHLFNIIVCS